MNTLKVVCVLIFNLLVKNLTAQHKILFVTSNQEFYGNTKITASNHFAEIVVPYEIFTKSGFSVDFISPKGGSIPIGYINSSDSLQKKYLYDGRFMDKLELTMKPRDINPDNYAAIFYSGGGSAMYGVAEDTTIQNIARSIYDKNGVVSTICHGTAGIAFLKDKNGKSLYAGRKITGFPDKFENRRKPYYKAFPFLIDKAIRSNDGNFVFSERERDGFYVVDGRFVTGQDPSSATYLANAVVKLLIKDLNGPKNLHSTSDLQQITNALLDYIEGTANGEPERLRRSFHPDFNLYFVGQDSLRIWSGREYIDNIKEGEKNDRKGKIISIDFVNNAASATIEIDIPSRKRIYTDYLLLLKFQGSWKIIHKSFTFKEYSTLSDKAQKIDKILSSYHQFDLLNGSVLIAQNGKEVLKKSYGKANFSWSINNSTTTKFRIGSLTKQFTALLILQLKQEGKLKLDDKIITHLPWYFRHTGRKLTIHHLLSMTSGLPNYTDEANPIMEREELSPKEFAQKYFKDTLLFEPGKNISYCNTGYYILGLIVEAITKQSYEKVLFEKVFLALGMRNSGIETPNQSLQNLAEGYNLYMGDYITPHSINMKTMTFSAGAIYSTVEDLYLWDKSFYSDQLLNAENRKLMCTKYLPNYGYGVAVNNLKSYLGTNKDITIISHDGGIGGFSSYMARIPEDSIFIVILDNTRAGMRGNDLVGISNNILPILYNSKAEIPKPMANIELLRLIKATSIDKGIIQFKNAILINKDGYNFNGFEENLNTIGYNYISNGDLISAVKILKFTTEQFPNSANAHDSLGEAYLKNNQLDLALQHYTKSYELDPKNENAKKRIEEIHKLK